MNGRLPKGFGGVIKLRGNRTKPYMVRVKVGTIVNHEKGLHILIIKYLVILRLEKMASLCFKNIIITLTT